MCASAKTCKQTLEKEQDFPLHPVNHSFRWLNTPILCTKPARTQPTRPKPQHKHRLPGLIYVSYERDGLVESWPCCILLCLLNIWLSPYSYSIWLWTVTGFLFSESSTVLPWYTVIGSEIKCNQTPKIQQLLIALLSALTSDLPYSWQNR